jgi:hypothetical protein
VASRTHRRDFAYAPAIAFLFLPFGFLPLQLSAFVFYALKLVALWWVGATIARRAGSPSRRNARSPLRSWWLAATWRRNCGLGTRTFSASG